MTSAPYPGLTLAEEKGVRSLYASRSVINLTDKEGLEVGLSGRECFIAGMAPSTWTTHSLPFGLASHHNTDPAIAPTAIALSLSGEQAYRGGVK